MDLRKVGVNALRISRKQMGTGSVSGQPRSFGGQQGKLRETRVTVRFPVADRNVPINHGLRRTPTSWQAMPSTRTSGTQGNVYADSPLPADNRVLCLKCTQAGQVAEIIVR